MVYTSVVKISDSLTKSEENTLNELVRKHNIDAVIISTEPLAHFKYAKWALNSRFHVLMDKPVTTEIDVSTDIKKAKKIFKDFSTLKSLYLGNSKKKQLVFTLQAQRRYHLGFKRVKDLIVEMANKTNCPVTSIQTFHSDGQWRFPREIVEQDYHPYNQGYGKMSHSGYHSLDAAVWFVQASTLGGQKAFDNFEVYSQAMRPLDFLHQVNPEDYRRLFPGIPEGSLMSGDSLRELLEGDALRVTGEIDAHSLIALKRGDITIANMGVHALHNGFGQRNWISAAGRDLYKSNGRVRHESYVIEQGPFQCVIISSFQSQEILKDNVDAYGVGGEYHFDIHIFRNSTLFPEYKAYELVSMKDINLIADLEYSRGHQENARRDCVDEFIQSILSGQQRNQESSLLSHELSTQLLSAIYQSLATHVRNRVIKEAITNGSH